MAIKESWYAELAELYGEEFCYKAGYFDETKPFQGSYYKQFNAPCDLPVDTHVIQFSGAFHPFHEGHLSIVKQAIKYVRSTCRWPAVVIHVDHSEYRHSKGSYDEAKFRESFMILNDLGCDVHIVYEDHMPNGASRNFTRLYGELSAHNRSVWFLSGGDRANYAASFLVNGRCIIAGRSDSEMYRKYRHLAHSTVDNDPRIVFIPGNHPASSTAIRNAA